MSQADSGANHLFHPIEKPRPVLWILPAAVLLASIYLPTLTTRFDFIDDGNLVYPTGSLSAGERLGVVWQKIVANYEDLGPFRPVLWLHWEIAADAFQGHSMAWRAARLLWTGLAAGMLLWLLAELRIPRSAAFVTAAIAMANPYRNEIWTSLTLAEGVAMPYALFSLVAARRALGSRHPLVWDLLGAGAVLAALGCKNTFAALVPAQVFLRVAADDLPLRTALRQHGWRAAALSLTLLAPVAHFLYFRWHWHAGQYEPGTPSLEQLRRMLSGLSGAISLDLIGVGLLLAIVAILRRARAPELQPVGPNEWNRLSGRTTPHRAALGAGLLLLAGGIGVYLPMNAMSGRYTMPAVWGLDLLLAMLWATWSTTPRSPWKTAAGTALGMGLAAMVVANLGKQEKFAARAALLWQALEWVEREAPAGATIAWISDDGHPGSLNIEEGVHFQWHLAARGRTDLHIGFFGEGGERRVRRELAGFASEPAMAIWGEFSSLGHSPWVKSRHFVASYWVGRRHFACTVGTREENYASFAPLTNADRTPVPARVR